MGRSSEIIAEGADNTHCGHQPLKVSKPVKGTPFVVARHVKSNL